jgi:hypothetical protein
VWARAVGEHKQAQQPIEAHITEALEAKDEAGIPAEQARLRLTIGDAMRAFPATEEGTAFADEIAARVQAGLENRDSLKSLVFWLKLLLAPLCVAIAAAFVKWQTDEASARVGHYLALNQDFYRDQIGKLYDGYSLVSDTDDDLRRAVLTPSDTGKQSLRARIRSLGTWFERNEFYLSNEAIEEADSLVLKGLAVLQAIEQNQYEEAKQARVMWEEQSTKVKGTFRKDARHPSLGELPKP